jgi:hypothetical protein
MAIQCFGLLRYVLIYIGKAEILPLLSTASCSRKNGDNIELKIY